MDESGVLQCSGERMVISPNTFSVPMYFTVLAGLQDFTVSFKHIGAIEVLHLTNQTARQIHYEPLGYQSSVKWWFDAFTCQPTKGVYNELPYTPEWVGATDIAGGYTREFYTWFVPNGNRMTNARLVAEINGGHAVSANEKSSSVTFQRGKAYHVRAAWNGARLFFGDEDVEAYDVVYSMNPMHWFAVHSFDGEKFLNTWDIDPDGNGYPSTTGGPSDYDSGDTHYRTPTIEEWRVMFPTHDEMLVFDEARDTFNCVETIEIKKQTMRFLSDYRNLGNGVSYALRMKSNRSNHCYAYRYAMYVIPKENYDLKYLSVTSRFIDDKSIGLDAIANESFWATQMAGDQRHIFPFHGYYYTHGSADWHWTAYSPHLGEGGVYWAILGNEGNEIWSNVLIINNHTITTSRWNWNHHDPWNSYNYYAMQRFIIDD